MAKNNNYKASGKGSKKNEKQPNLSMTPLMVFGFVLIVLNVALAQFIDGYAQSTISTIVYLVAVLAFVVYMYQIAFEKRTGKKELSEDEKPRKKKK